MSRDPIPWATARCYVVLGVLVLFQLLCVDGVDEGSCASGSLLPRLCRQRSCEEKKNMNLLPANYGARQLQVLKAELASEMKEESELISCVFLPGAERTHTGLWILRSVCRNEIPFLQGCLKIRLLPPARKCISN